MNRDLAEMLSALSEVGAEYLVADGYAVIAHGYPRAIGDIDIWVRPLPANAEKVMLALKRFGAPLADLTEQDLEARTFEMRGVAPGTWTLHVKGQSEGEVIEGRVDARPGESVGVRLDTP